MTTMVNISPFNKKRNMQTHWIYPIIKYPTISRPESQINSNNVHINKNNVISGILCRCVCVCVQWAMWATENQPEKYTKIYLLSTKSHTTVWYSIPFESSRNLIEKHS